MSFIDIGALPVIERKPGWHGRYFNSPSMTFARYDFEAGAEIPEHSHVQEEVWQVLEGELEIMVAGVATRAKAGWAGIVPPDTLHSVRAVTDGKAIVVDTPIRDMTQGA